MTARRVTRRCASPTWTASTRRSTSPISTSASPTPSPGCATRPAPDGRGRMGGVTPDLLAALGTAEGVSALRSATAVADGDPLVAASALRGQGLPADLAAAALTQAALRSRAAAKFGADAARMFFTRPGAEKGTRALLAARR